MEHQQLEGWKWNRPGDRLLDIGNPLQHIKRDQLIWVLLHKHCNTWRGVCFAIDVDIPMSVGITALHTNSSQLNAAEFLWDSKRASVFVQVRDAFHFTPICRSLK